MSAVDEWPAVTLENVCESVRYGYTTSATAKDTGVRFLRVTDIAGGPVVWDAVPYCEISKEDFERHQLQSGDIVIARMGTIGVSARIDHEQPAVAASYLIRHRVNLRVADSRFVSYVLKGPRFWDFIWSHGGGAVQPNINARVLGGFSFALPPIREQRRIATLLGALDDKIELNRRMSETLDHVAGSWFKRWFVDGVDLPVEADDAVPADDWAVRPLDDIAGFLNGAACQKYPARHGEPSLPVIKIRELNQGITKQSDRVTQQIPEKWHVRNGDVLFSWSGTLIAKVWTGGPAALNQHLFKVTSAEYPKWFHLRWVLHHLDHFRGVAADKATTMGHIKRHHLSDAMCLVPPEPVLQAMTRLMGPLLDRHVVCENESRTLAAIRDALLPKLINGELRIPDAEQLVSEVT